MRVCCVCVVCFVCCGCIAYVCEFVCFGVCGWLPCNLPAHRILCCVVGSAAVVLLLRLMRGTVSPMLL